MELGAGQARPGRFRSRRIRITFEAGHPYEGLEVIMRPAPLDALLGMLGDASAVEGMGDGAPPAADQIDGFRALCGELAGFITEWNIDDDQDQPVTPGKDGLLGCEPGIVLAIFTAYAEKLVTVPPPLPAASPAGPSPEAGIPVIPVTAEPGGSPSS